MDLERFPTSPSAKRMLASVSEEFYAKAYVAKWLYQVMGLEWDTVREIIDALPEQSFVETATWGLTYHEIKWGLPIRENLDCATRRRLIYEKRDVRLPMNPWAMERLIADLTGERASVKDSNDDPTVSVNTFAARIDSENPGVDIIAVIRAVQKVKQSHVCATLYIEPKARAVPLHIGARGAVISRLSPVEQPDSLSGTQTLRTGGQAAAIAQQPPSEQPDNLRAAQTIRAGGQFAPLPHFAPAEQSDNLRAAQAVRTGGQAAAIAQQSPTERPDDLSGVRIVRHAGRPAIVHVLRGRQVD